VALVVSAPLGAQGPDVDLVEALARLELAARRLGWALCVTETSDDLVALLHLTGLAGVVGASGAGAGGRLGLEPGGEPEGREQLGEQEVVPADDPPA
jgi:hypothetical protein